MELHVIVFVVFSAAAVAGAVIFWMRSDDDTETDKSED